MVRRCKACRCPNQNFQKALGKYTWIESMEKLRIATLVSKAALQFIQGIGAVPDYVVPEEVQAAGFQICADEVGSIVESRGTKKLKFHGGVDGIAEKLCTSTTRGLSDDNIKLPSRQSIYGTNTFAESNSRTFRDFLHDARQDFTLKIDLACAFLSLIIGMLMEGWPDGGHDAFIIFVTIFSVVLVSATNDYWQHLQFRFLDGEKKKFVVKVTRNGFRHNLSPQDLLPGDIVHLATGGQVPADGLYISGFSMLVDESSLTGENESLLVNTDNPFLRSGTKVLDGSCKMMVTAVGARTQWSKLMEISSQEGEDETPLQVKLQGVASFIGTIGVFLAVATFAVLFQGLLSMKIKDGTQWNWSHYDALQIFEHFTIAFTVFSVAVPDGLPLAMTLILAFSVKKIMDDKAIIRNPAACEAMATVSNICTGKTGILTTNHITVAKTCICMKLNQTPDSGLGLLLQSIFANTSGEVARNIDGELEIVGTPTETALLNFGLSLGGDFAKEREGVKILQVDAFSSTKKRMAVALELPNGNVRVHATGASEIILATCDKVIGSNGEVVFLDETSTTYLKSVIDDFATEGLRTLCLAYTDLEHWFFTKNAIPTSGYTCIGILGMINPIRPGVKESIRICHAAGITVRMITGENLNTAKAIAQECGILTDDGIAIEASCFQQQSMEDLVKLIPKLQVVARCSPEDKHTFVNHLKTTFNEVVAVTGRGPDDAWTLDEADVGLALGISGTEAAKEKADVTILDDSFSSIVRVARWGRSIFINVKKFVQFQLTVITVASILNISSACLTGNAPFSDVELLWVTLFTDTLGAFALAAEALNDDLMNRQPVPKAPNVFTNVMLRNFFGQCFFQVAVIWFIQAKGKAVLKLDGPDSDLILDTFIFNTFIFCQLSNLISSRKMEEINVFKGIHKNKVLMIVVFCTVGFEITIIEFLGPLASTSHLNLRQWFLSVLIGMLGIPAAALVKLIPI